MYKYYYLGFLDLGSKTRDHVVSIDSTVLPDICNKTQSLRRRGIPVFLVFVFLCLNFWKVLFFSGCFFIDKFDSFLKATDCRCFVTPQKLLVFYVNKNEQEILLILKSLRRGTCFLCTFWPQRVHKVSGNFNGIF